MTGYSSSQVDALVSQRQTALSNAAGSDTELLNGTTLRRLAATSPLSLSVDSDVVTIASDAPSLADTPTAIASALTSYTLTSALTTLLAGKQSTLSSASGSGRIPLLDGTTVRRLATACDEGVVAMTESAGTVTLSINGYSRNQVDNLISASSASLTDASVTGLTLRTGSELKRLHVAAG